MRFSRMLLPTLKEAPSDAEVASHRLMVRAGMIRRVAAGIYTLLPLGLKTLRRVERIIREEMDRAGAQELFMPTVIPAELWQKSGRWNAYGKELLRIKDRNNRDFCLGPTHEEVITELVGREIRSYRDLPLNLYQIQTKFRDEIRPRFGLMRGREFMMKDAYSFHGSEDDAEKEYRNMFDTYCRIFERCGLDFRPVEAETGSIGGSFSHEFMVLAETGEDGVAGCGTCSYAANVERAETKPLPPAAETAEPLKSIESVSTPAMKSVDDVSAFLKVPSRQLIKTLVYNSDKGVVAALVRGDYDLNEAKLLREFGAAWIELADEETIVKTTGAPSGFAGPVGLNCAVLADHSIKTVVNGVTGANAQDTHLKNVNPGRDFTVTSFHDLRVAVEGDGCPRCTGTLSIWRGIEVGHAFKLGTKYSEAMGATFLDEAGSQQPMIMGCYGIGVGRTVAACIEQNHDDSGIVWPLPLAPYPVTVLPLSAREQEVTDAAEKIYGELTGLGIDVLLDDRDERAGVKFNDADLIGIPVRIVIGKKGLKEGAVEIKRRDGDEVKLVALEGVVDEVRRIVPPPS